MKWTRGLYLFFMVSIVLATMLLLLNAATHPVSHTVKAAGVNLQDQPTATPPRNIFLNGTCADNGQDSMSEHIRFGNETSHYFQFLGKSGDWYTVTTEIFSTVDTSISLDTKLLVYRRNPVEHSSEPPLAENDDKPFTEGMSGTDRYESELTFTATEDRVYWIEVQNLVNNGSGSYCLKIKPVISPNGDNEPDRCEFNNTIDTACEIEIRAQIPFSSEPTPGIPTLTPVPIPPNTQEDPLGIAGTFTYNFVPPVGQSTDLDYYKLWVKAGQNYICQTYNLSSGTDTNIIFFNHEGGEFDPPMGNDDIAPGNKASKLAITPSYTGWLHILVNTYDELVDYEYAERYTYQFACANELQAPFNEPVKDIDPDKCEVNDSFDLASACQIILKQTPKGEGYFEGTLGNKPGDGNQVANADNGHHKTPLNFAPWSSGIRDVDHYRLWSKAGWRYTCLTQELTNGNDTLMTLYYADNGLMTPGNNPNDDYQPNKDLASKVSIDYEDTRTGWLIIKVEPSMSYIPSEGGRYQYQLVCQAYPPLNEQSFHNLNGLGTNWDATHASGEESLPPAAETSTVVEASAHAAAALPPTPTPPAPSNPAAVSFVALAAPTATPVPPQAKQTAAFTIQIYYDANDNHVKDEGEGVSDLPLYIYTGLSDTPHQAVTTAGGAAFVETETAVGRVQLLIPYFNINQELTVTTARDIRLRIAP